MNKQEQLTKNILDAQIPLTITDDIKELINIYEQRIITLNQQTNTLLETLDEVRKIAKRD